MICAFPESFVVWLPRDIVSGDMYYVTFAEEGAIVALLDCTGHGVPGAFMTMLAYSAIRRVVSDENVRDPAGILARMNAIVRASLQQDPSSPACDNGVDVAVCLVRPGDRTLLFAGARLPLFTVQDGKATQIAGDRRGLGSRRSPADHRFTTHTVPIGKDLSF